jgi:hypothetical protein
MDIENDKRWRSNAHDMTRSSVNLRARDGGLATTA